MKRYYQIVENTETKTADVYIYGSITSSAELIDAYYKTETGAKSARGIVGEIEDLTVDTINVYINSYGGEVAEALAIYTALKRHPAQVHTFCDGFACSAASVVFVAGDVRTMGALSLLMIHNASTMGRGTAEDMRKAAEDLDKITAASVTAYMQVCRGNLTEDDIKTMMNRETWLDAEDAVKFGFATEIADADDADEPEQSAFSSVYDAIMDRHDMQSVEERLDGISSCLRGIVEIYGELMKEKESSEEEVPPEETAPPEKPPVKRSFYERYIKRS